MAFDTAQYKVNLGTPPDAKDGDTNRAAHIKLNQFYDDVKVPLAKVDAIPAAGFGNAATLNVGTTANTVAAGDDSRFAASAEIANRLATFRNKFMNGNFAIWQRGTSFNIAASAGAKTADRWKVNTIGSSAAISRTFNAGGIGGIDGNPQYCASVTVNSVLANGNAVNLFQDIENVTTIQGRKATLTFWARSSVAGKKIGAELYQNFGSGGSTGVSVPIQSVALTTSFAKYTMTFDIPSTAGKTIGDSDTMLFIFWLDAGSDFNSRSSSTGQGSAVIDITNAQLEAGATATEFEKISLAASLQLCMRYFQKSFNQGTTPAHGSGEVCMHSTATYFDNNAVAWLNLPVPMRKGPAITFYSPSVAGGTSGQWAILIGNWTTTTSLAAYNATERQMTMTFTATGAKAGSAIYTQGHYTLDAEY